MEAPPVITVDSHVHILPLRLATKIRTFFESSGMVSPPSSDAAVSSCCTPTRPANGIPLAYPIDPSTLLQILLREGIPASTTPRPGAIVATPSSSIPATWTLPYAHQPDMSLVLNRSIIDLAASLNIAAEGKLRVVPGLTVHPGDGCGEKGGLKAEEVLQVALRQGARVVKLHCSVGSYSVLDERLERFWILAQAVRVPVVIHAGTSIMGTTSSSELSDISALCTRYPCAVIILAHAGHPATSRALSLTSLHPSLHLDTTPVISSLVSLPVSRHLLTLALSSRILFGSDCPNTSISRPDAAQAVREWVRECVSREMGSGSREDSGAEMDRIAGRAEREVLGGAADKLERGVRDVKVVVGELGWPVVKGAERESRL